MDLFALRHVFQPVCLGIVVGLVLGAEALFIMNRIDATLDRHSEPAEPPADAPRARYEVGRLPFSPAPYAGQEQRHVIRG